MYLYYLHIIPLTAFSLHVYIVLEVWDLHIVYSNRKRLRDCFIFKFVLLRHILIVHTNNFFCERLNFNPLIRIFLHFTIVVLTWYDLTSYYIVLPMSIYARILHALIIYCRCIVYITN